MTGWLIGIPVPFVVAWADSWSWIVAANVLLGVNALRTSRVDVPS
jgi:hypothetical protein